MLLTLTTSPPIKVWSIACLYVCVFVCLCLSVRIFKKRTSKFHLIFCKCYLWPWLDTLLTAMRYVMYFWFSGCRHIFMYWKEQARIKYDAHVSPGSPDGGTNRTSDNVVWSRSPSSGIGAKSDCILFRSVLAVNRRFVHKRPKNC